MKVAKAKLQLEAGEKIIQATATTMSLVDVE